MMVEHLMAQVMLLYYVRNMFLKGFFTLLIVSFFGTCVNGQVKGSKEAVKKFRAAEAVFSFSDYRSALKLYKELYHADSLNGKLALRIGACMYNLRMHKEQSRPYFERAMKAGEAESYFYLGNLYHLAEDFEKSRSFFEKYKAAKLGNEYYDSIVNHMIKCSLYAEKMKAKSNRITIENMGKGINSSYPDYVPLISADESTLIFTSRRDNSTGRLLDPNGEYFEDIYVSRKVDGNWTSPKSISKNINTEGHDACVALSADGEQMILYKTSEDLMSGDLYITSFTGKDWTEPVLLGSDINTEEGVEPSASFSADNNALYFSSNREGSLGGKDIYRVVKLPDGQWSKASNLGNVINTQYEEDAPFIHPDGKTLYFSSHGFNNMGGYDIFKTVYDENDNTWSIPENLGYPINSVDNDIYFVLSVSGKTGYYSSKKSKGLGETDIYKINMPDTDFNLQAHDGVVLSETGEPLVAKVTVTEEGRSDVVGIYKTNKLTGKYLLILPPGTYQITIEADGYATHTSVTDFSGDGNHNARLKKLQTN